VVEVDVPLQDFFKSPTVAGLAAQIDAHHRTGSTAKTLAEDSILKTIVPIQPSGSRIPFFCIAPAGGVVFPYYNLAPYLGPDQPFYGLQDPGLDMSRDPYLSLEDLAKHYIASMRTIQGEGPYLVGGWSFGGIAAFEIARQLHESGDKVGLVVLMDTGAIPPGDAGPPTLRTILDVALGIPKYALWALGHAGPYVKDGLYVLASAARTQRDQLAGRTSFIGYIRWMGLDLLRRRSLRKSDIASAIPENSELLSVRQPAIHRILRVNNANARAMRRYNPQVYPGRLTLLRAENQSRVTRYSRDPFLGWGQLTSKEVDVRPVRGNHVVIFRKPWIEDFGRTLKVCLDEAQVRK
jgi:thioesterase domain-containing protein